MSGFMEAPAAPASELEAFTERVNRGELDDVEDNVEQAWEVLKGRGIDVVVGLLTGASSTTRPFGTKDNMSLHLISYRTAESFGRQSDAGAERLYEGYAAVLNDFLDQQMAEAKTAGYDLSGLGEDVYRWWDRYRTLVRWLHKVLGHLDAGYVSKERLESLTTVALRKFHRKVYSAEMGEKVTRMLISRLNQERDGETVDDHFLQRCIELFVTMGAALNRKDIPSFKALRPTMADLGEYERNFQRPFLQASAAYWSARAQEWLDTCDTPEFVMRADEAVRAEMQRARKYLPPSSEILVLDVVQRELLVRCGEQVLADPRSGGPALLDRGDLASLRRAHRLFRSVDPCLALLARQLQAWITAQGLRTLGDVRDGGFVKELLDLHQQHRELLAQTFDSDATLERSLKLAYTTVVNADSGAILSASPGDERDAAPGAPKPAMSTNEVLVRYLDRVLRGLERTLGDAGAESAIENIMGIFTYLRDKDFFLEVHRNLLCKRLLGSRAAMGTGAGISAEIERERAVIAAMKLHMGTSFTSKIEGMVNDFLLGRGLQLEYADALAEDGGGEAKARGTLATAAEGGYDFRVQMLTMGFWPAQEAMEPTIPAHLARRLRHFEDWYTRKHTHRTLKWIHSLGEVEVKAYFRSRSYTMSMSPFQALVLQHFDDNPNVTFTVAEVRDALGLDDHIISRVLHGLCCRPKTRILSKTGAAGAVAATDAVSVNRAFTSKQMRFKVLQPALLRVAAQKVVKADRSHAIDATLVRTMKARKQLSHSELVQECLRQLTHFSPEARAIKLRIASLIERDYLERDPDNEKVYRYVP